MKINVNQVTYKQLTKADIPTLLEIQEETFAHAGGDTSFLRRNTAETFAVCFEEPSVTIGAFLDGTLIAFGMLHAAGSTEENLAKDVDEIENVLDNANVKLTIVRPQYRGNGLQALLIDKLTDHAKANGFTWACSTAAPDNIWSMNNLQKCGFVQVKLLQKYGGLQRALLCKKL